MKILISTFTFLPERSGVSNVVLEHASYFVNQGHEVTIATSKNTERIQLSLEGIKVIEFDADGGPLIFNFYRGEIFKYLKFLNKAQIDYDLIFFHGWQIWATDLYLFSKKQLHSAKSIFVSHCSPVTEWSNLKELIRTVFLLPYKFFIIPLLMKKFDEIIFLSNKLKGNRQWDYRYALKHKDNLHIIPNGIPLKEIFEPSTSSLQLKNNIPCSKIILYVANYDRLKNQMLALEVFDMVSASKDLHLVFIGSNYNSYTQKLENYSKQLGVEDRVSILSELSREDVLYFFSISYASLFTSRSECCPLSVLESLAYRKPVVATDVGCLDQIRGVKVCKDKDSLVYELNLLLDQEYYHRRVADTDLSIQDLSWSKIMKEYNRFLD
jgi:glycosyltransferase involved in cell wall biosynthesis